jgi:hypothetical protein
MGEGSVSFAVAADGLLKDCFVLRQNLSGKRCVQNLQVGYWKTVYLSGVETLIFPVKL